MEQPYRELTAADLAERLGISMRAVRGWPQSGCPATNYGRGGGNGYRFNIDEVRVWLANTGRRITHGGGKARSRWGTRGKETLVCAECGERKPHHIRYDATRENPRPYPHCVDCRASKAAGYREDRASRLPLVECPYCRSGFRRGLNGKGRHCNRECADKWKGLWAEWRRHAPRLCTTCRVVQPYDEFYGGSRTCKECIRRHRRERQDAIARRIRDAGGTVEEKACTACRKVRPAACFHRSNTRTDGLALYCRECTAERVRSWEAKREEEEPGWRRRQRARARLRTYGLEQAQYAAMLEDQGGVCDICGTDEWRGSYGRSGPVVDHDHDTGDVRGLLCGQCNKALGHFFDDPLMLINAALYLMDNGKPLGAIEKASLRGFLSG